MVKVSKEALDKRNIVGVNRETVTNVSSQHIPGHYYDENSLWTIDAFRENLSVAFHKHTRHEAVFSLIGVDASIANAIRRILLAETPSLVIEDVYINQNTSIIQDEVLAHRLGLIPWRANRAGLRWMRWKHRSTPENFDPSESTDTDFNTLVFKLSVKCGWTPNGRDLMKAGETDPFKLYTNAHIYARDIVFEAAGQQETYFSQEAGTVEPTNPDILLAKMRPGQELDVVMHANFGIGADHAKFSPVATATYRLMPVIEITKPILGADAKKFARCFPRGVIGLEEVTAKEARVKGSGYEGRQGEVKAVVKDAIRDTVSRECLRHDEFEGKVKLGRRRDHVIFSVESTGQWDSDELVLESIKILRAKCERLKRNLADLTGFD